MAGLSTVTVFELGLVLSSKTATFHCVVNDEKTAIKSIKSKSTNLKHAKYHGFFFDRNLLASTKTIYKAGAFLRTPWFRSI